MSAQELVGGLPLLIAVFAILAMNARLSKVKRSNARLHEERDAARRREAELEAVISDREQRSERNRQNSIQLVENQIDAVNDNTVSFHRRPVMNRGESKVFYAAKDALVEKGLNGWHVFPQVSLGEFIGTDSRWEFRANRAHQSINSKRCDVLIANHQGLPVVVIEHQGSGHYRGNAEGRDAVKRIAAGRAAIGFVEVPDGLTRTQIKELILRAI